MSKTKSMTLQCIGVFAMFLFVWWWVDREHEKVHCGGKTCKKASDCPGVASNAQIKPIKVYDGVWRKDYLEVIK